jgi:hypothetical protein
MALSLPSRINILRLQRPQRISLIPITLRRRLAQALFQAIHGVVVEPFLPELLAECAFSGAMSPEIAFATAVVVIYGPSWETVITCNLLVFFNSSSSSPLTPLSPKKESK